MIRQEAFLASLALYAVDLSGLSVSDPCRRQRRSETTGQWEIDPEAPPFFRLEVPAVWYRRRKGLDAANAGRLWTFSDDIPRVNKGGAVPRDSARRAMGFAFADGRHGPHNQARWDGEFFWHDPSMPQEHAEKVLAFLREMLAAYPEIPDGFDGWWRFPKRGKASRG